MHRRFAAALALALAVAAPSARADDPPAASAEAPPYDFYCPECRLPLRWDQDACPGCKTEFEPLRPRTKKGEGGPGYEPAPSGPAKGGEGEGEGTESPFGERTEPAPERLIESPWPQIQPPAASRFGFGSYGRVGVLVDEQLDGALDASIVDFKPRINKGPYQELHFYYKDTINEMPVLVKTTMAFEEDLFHLNGDFDARFALRELYAELEPTPDLAVWLGARMYRGDDIYLYDFWPLDDQNTVGIGAAIRITDTQRIQLHTGFNRIVDESFFQFQQIELPTVDGIGVREAVFLDRYRLTSSATYRLQLGDFLFKLHAEGTYLPPGERIVQGNVEQRLPADHGFLIGGELGYHFSTRSFIRLFASYHYGLSAFDELQIPFGFDRDFRVTDAWRVRVALGGAIDTDIFGMHYGAYWQRFEDADGEDDFDDQEQAAVAIRPLFYLGEYFRLGAELGLQAQRREGVFIETGDEETSLVTSFRLLAGLATGKGTFARPVLYAFWGMDFLNDGAQLELGRRLAEPPDKDAHVFGILAEWWF